MSPTQNTETQTEVFSVNYYSQSGRLFVRKHNQAGASRPFLVYFQDQGQEPQLYESHSSQNNAEAAARWMAGGL